MCPLFARHFARTHVFTYAPAGGTLGVRGAHRCCTPRCALHAARARTLRMRGVENRAPSPFLLGLRYLLSVTPWRATYTMDRISRLEHVMRRIKQQRACRARAPRVAGERTFCTPSSPSPPPHIPHLPPAFLTGQNFGRDCCDARATAILKRRRNIINENDIACCCGHEEGRTINLLPSLSFVHCQSVPHCLRPLCYNIICIIHCMSVCHYLFYAPRLTWLVRFVNIYGKRARRVRKIARCHTSHRFGMRATQKAWQLCGKSTSPAALWRRQRAYNARTFADRVGGGRMMTTDGKADNARADGRV